MNRFFKLIRSPPASLSARFFCDKFLIFEDADPYLVSFLFCLGVLCRALCGGPCFSYVHSVWSYASWELADADFWLSDWILVHSFGSRGYRKPLFVQFMEQKRLFSSLSLCYSILPPINLNVTEAPALTRISPPRPPCRSGCSSRTSVACSDLVAWSIDEEELCNYF